MEEAGVEIVIRGVLRIELKDGCVRVIFHAEPTETSGIKSTANQHSQMAKWASIEEISEMKLRRDDILKWAIYLNEGGIVFPQTILAHDDDAIVN